MLHTLAQCSRTMLTVNMVVIGSEKVGCVLRRLLHVFMARHCLRGELVKQDQVFASQKRLPSAGREPKNLQRRTPIDQNSTEIED